MDGDEKATLTQRRALSGADKLDRGRLRTLSDVSGKEETAKGNAAKIVVWIVILIVLGAAGYLGLRAFVNRGGTDTTVTTPTPTVEPTTTVLDKILASEVKADSDAFDLQPDSKYATTNQTAGSPSEDAYTIESMLIQPYETFIRVEFVVTSDGDNDFPEVSAIYNTETSEIELNLKSIVSNKAELDQGETVNLPSSLVQSLTRNTVEDNLETYVISLAEMGPYVLHTYTEALVNKIAIDIKEPGTEVAETTPTPSLSVTPTTTVTATAPGGTNLTNEFSTNNQFITTATSGNVVKIKKYTFADYSDKFIYNLYLDSNTYPNVSSEYNENNLIIKVSNVASDNIVGNGGSGMTDFAARGAKDISKANISNSGNVTTFEFEINKKLQHRIFIDESNNYLVLEIKH